MLYAVKYRYVDLGGTERVLLDGFSFESGSLSDVQAGEYGNPDFCAYSCKKSAGDVKRLLDDMLCDMKRRKMCRKTWKAKIVEVAETEIPDDNLDAAVKNAALRYYFSLCVEAGQGMYRRVPPS